MLVTYHEKLGFEFFLCQGTQISFTGAHIGSQVQASKF